MEIVCIILFIIFNELSKKYLREYVFNKVNKDAVISLSKYYKLDSEGNLLPPKKNIYYKLFKIKFEEKFTFSSNFLYFYVERYTRYNFFSMFFAYLSLFIFLLKILSFWFCLLSVISLIFIIKYVLR